MILAPLLGQKRLQSATKHFIPLQFQMRIIHVWTGSLYLKQGFGQRGPSTWQPLDVQTSLPTAFLAARVMRPSGEG